MSLSPDNAPLQREYRAFRAIKFVPIAGLCALLFVLNLGIGAPPSAVLDASWTEVLAWGYLHNAQWGRELVFTYGPLGFLHSAASYVPGTFSTYIAGQIALSAAFAITVTLALARAGKFSFFALFVLAYAACYPWVSVDTASFLTLMFGTSVLVRNNAQQSRQDVLGAALLAMMFGVIALLKFSLFPLWVVCVAALFADFALIRGWRRALVVPALFSAAIVALWLACSQQLGGLPTFLYASLAVALGYGHAMGTGAPLLVELVGAACIASFLSLLALVGWRSRHDMRALVALTLFAFSALLGWRIDLTRGDHWPWFFGIVALLPFVVLVDKRICLHKLERTGFIMLVLVGVAASIHPAGAIASRWQQLRIGLISHVRVLADLEQFRQEREAQWLNAKKNEVLPRISQRIGNARVDLMTVAQGVVLLNGWNYAPRPVFQSYSAYTPYLARLNEAYLVGPNAPDFVLLKLDIVDGRLPASEDALAMIALLQRYLPIMSENGYLLLQRDSAVAIGPVSPPNSYATATLGKAIPVNAPPSELTLAFVKLDLSLLGQIYTLLLREPILRIAIETDNGSYNYRFIAASASAGFVLSPLLRETTDWAKLSLHVPLPRVLSVRIEPQEAWQRIFFRNSFEIAFGKSTYLRPDASNVTAAMSQILYPGFDLMPEKVHGTNGLVIEDGKDALFLHAPGFMRFTPVPATYRLSSKFGIRSAALNAPDCTAANGIGITVVQLHADNEKALIHRELDPFHVAEDRGAHDLIIEQIKVEPGDSIEYRIDAGHGGGNTACDWAYVRNVVFDRDDQTTR